MRRQGPPVYDHVRRQHDIRTEVDPNKLATVGAIALQWNWLESALDAALTFLLAIPPEFAAHVTSRINGIDGKLEILKRGLAHRHFEKPLRDAASELAGAIEDHKPFRDALIHARTPSPDLNVLPTLVKRGVSYEVLFTQEALDDLYNRIKTQTQELCCLVQIIAAHAIPYMLKDSLSEDEKREIVEELPESVATFLEYQTYRKSLPRLPEWPEPPPTPPESAASQ